MQHLLLLHGAIGSKEQLQPLADALQEHYQVHSINFSGHGGEGFAAEPFSIHQFAGDVLQYLNKQALQNVTIFGYSMGGYVGLYLARFYPDRVGKLITLATKFEWDEATAAKQQKLFHAGNILEKAPALADQLRNTHGPHLWEKVLQRTAAMLLEMGKDNPVKPADLALVQTPVLLLQGDRDKMVPLEELLAVYRQLPDVRLSVLPDTPHALEQVDIPLLTFLIKQFAR